MKKELIINISATIIGMILGIAIMIGLYHWLGFEITLLLYIAGISYDIVNIKKEIKELQKTPEQRKIEQILKNLGE